MMTDIINLLKPLIEAPLKYINETDDEFKARITEKFMADNNMDKEAFVRGRGFGKTELGLEAMKAEIRRDDMTKPKFETRCKRFLDGILALEKKHDLSAELGVLRDGGVSGAWKIAGPSMEYDIESLMDVEWVPAPDKER